MLVLGVRPGEGVKVGNTQIVLENEMPERQLAIEHPAGGCIRISLGLHRTTLRFEDTEVVLWKTRGNSPKIGVSSDQKLPVTRIRRDTQNEPQRLAQVAVEAMPKSRQG